MKNIVFVKNGYKGIYFWLDSPMGHHGVPQWAPIGTPDPSMFSCVGISFDSFGHPKQFQTKQFQNR